MAPRAPCAQSSRLSHETGLAPPEAERRAGRLPSHPGSEVPAAEVVGEVREAEVEDLAPGDTAELEWTFTEPGDFQFACHLLDHYQRGMVVEIEVVE